MSHQTLSIIIGGLIPALLYGLAGIFSKGSAQAGIGVGWYILITGLTIAAVGGLLFLYSPDYTINMKSGLHAVGLGATWALGTALVMLSLLQYQTPISKLVPLYNMNTLVAVLLALWIFAEWKQVKVPQLVLGSALIVIGGTLVARS